MDVLEVLYDASNSSVFVAEDETEMESAYCDSIHDTSSEIFHANDLQSEYVQVSLMEVNSERLPLPDDDPPIYDESLHSNLSSHGNFDELLICNASLPPATVHDPTTRPFQGGRRHRRRSRHSRSRHRHPRNLVTTIVCGCNCNSQNRCLISMFFNVIASFLILSAVIMKNWFFIHGGCCRTDGGIRIESLGVSQFLAVGHFASSPRSSFMSSGHAPTYIYHSYGTHLSTLYDCVSPGVVHLIHTIAVLCFLSILTSVVAAVVNFFGPVGKNLQLVKTYAYFSVSSVIICIGICVLSYVVALRLLDVQNTATVYEHHKVVVTFDSCFYLVAGAGAVSLVAVACSLLSRPNVVVAPVVEDDLNLLIESLDEQGEQPVPTGGPPPYTE